MTRTMPVHARTRPIPHSTERAYRLVWRRDCGNYPDEYARRGSFSAPATAVVSFALFWVLGTSAKLVKRLIGIAPPSARRPGAGSVTAP